MAERFDLIVIGAGPGGYVAAIRAAQLGMKVACVDKRDTLGGTCLNVGCIPSKALLDSSELYAQARTHFSRHGIKVGEVGLDLPAMLARKDKVVKGLTDGVAFLFKKNKITPVAGAARVEGMGRVTVKGKNNETTELEAKAVLLATGSEPVGIPALPFDGSHIVGSTEALAFDRVPQHLIVVGAGYIGLELGSVWSRLGAKVTVVEFLPRILPLSDAEIAEQLRKSLTKQGLTFHLDTKVLSASTQGGQVIVNATSKGKDVLFQGDKVLVAVGRRPNTAGLGLKEIGVETDERSGRIRVDENFQTSVAGVYAIGDVIEGPMLAHKASEDGVAFVERLAGYKSEVNYDTVPSVIYTWPEVASVGPTEEEVKTSGREYKVGRFPFSANPRARCMDETEGLVKMIADARTDRLLAVHIFGPRASDLIAECVTVLEFAGSAEDIARICHAHPTLSEAVHEAALAVDKRAIHI
ncbi:MAG TPA: dihydrolipoyl dehydrogenase [Gemmataceae bacterium]|jgi:dihydrolipoamide dehydrogenase|nr:dihydrolipoyl dehydrogenase [Gemmataceae bacterium]